MSLYGMSRSKKNKTKSLPKIYKEIPPFTCLKGSYTVEAAIVIPLVVGFWMCIMLFFRILQIQTAVTEALDYAGRMTAIESCQIESEAGILVSAKALFLKEINQYPVVDRYVSGGKYGVLLGDSDLSGDVLRYKATYRVKLPVAFFSVKSVKVEQSSAHRKWTGKRLKGDVEDDRYVYVAENGKVYHLSRSCAYLDLSIRGVSFSDVSKLRNKDGSRYSACSCAEKGGLVYITDYGTRYHSRLSCSGLKRTVYMVRRSKVGSKGLCSKCAKAQ